MLRSASSVPLALRAVPREARRPPQRRLGDVDAGPERVQELVLRHGAAGVADEIAKEGEDQTLHRHGFTAVLQSARRLVQFELPEGDRRHRLSEGQVHRGATIYEG